MDTLGLRLRQEREKLGLNQGNFGTLVGVKKNAQLNYEAGRRSPDGEYFMAAAKAGVDVLYVLTGVRTAPAEPGVDRISAFDKPDKSEPVDPLIFKFCADIVADEYNRAGVELPQNAHILEAVWAYNKVLAQLPDPSDGEMMEAALPVVRELLRKRLADRTS
jgi:transcriptional regulator with XRE-family HTH domain